MTYAAIPALRHAPALAAEWAPRALKATYDPRFIPAPEKHAATIGMAMTEKQGGSDVHANATRAEPLGWKVIVGDPAAAATDALRGGHRPSSFDGPAIRKPVAASVPGCRH